MAQISWASNFVHLGKLKHPNKNWRLCCPQKDTYSPPMIMLQRKMGPWKKDAWLVSESGQFPLPGLLQKEQRHHEQWPKPSRFWWYRNILSSFMRIIVFPATIRIPIIKPVSRNKMVSFPMVVSTHPPFLRNSGKLGMFSVFRTSRLRLWARIPAMTSSGGSNLGRILVAKTRGISNLELPGDVPLINWVAKPEKTWVPFGNPR